MGFLVVCVWRIKSTIKWINCFKVVSLPPKEGHAFYECSLSHGQCMFWGSLRTLVVNDLIDGKWIKSQSHCWSAGLPCVPRKGLCNDFLLAIFPVAIPRLASGNICSITITVPRMWLRPLCTVRNARETISIHACFTKRDKTLKIRPRSKGERIDNAPEFLHDVSRCAFGTVHVEELSTVRLSVKEDRLKVPMVWLTG